LRTFGDARFRPSGTTLRSFGARLRPLLRSLGSRLWSLDARSFDARLIGSRLFDAGAFCPRLFALIRPLRTWLRLPVGLFRTNGRTLALTGALGPLAGRLAPRVAANIRTSRSTRVTLATIRRAIRSPRDPRILRQAQGRRRFARPVTFALRSGRNPFASFDVPAPLGNRPVALANFAGDFAALVVGDSFQARGRDSRIASGFLQRNG
jgi:hypothetical protein